MPIYRKVLKNYIPSCSKIILLFVQTHCSVFLYPFSNPFLCQCHTATILWQMRGFRLVILILIFAFCLECTECLVTEIVQHRGEAVLRKHLRTFEENQMSNIIRRTKGKRTLKFHQFNNTCSSLYFTEVELTTATYARSKCEPTCIQKSIENSSGKRVKCSSYPSS